MTREVRHVYRDPLDALWLECARRVGLDVVRSPASYATTDGHGTLSLSDQGGLDPDDCVAQMILHELCHSLVQGPESFGWVDWGLENETGEDSELEEACLRVQAALLDEYGLRQAFAPTTDYRAFYDALGRDPLEERMPSERASLVFARLAWQRRSAAPWAPHLDAALAATRALLDAAADFFVDRELVYAELAPRPALHRLGGSVHPDATVSCGTCAWAESKDDGRRRCVRHGRVVRPDERACAGFESATSCTACGACCREAYDVVLVGRRDPALKRALPQISHTRSGGEIPRPRGRCPALVGGTELRPIRPFLTGGAADGRSDAKPRYAPSDESPFSCVIYDERPTTCRDFTRGSRNCLDARRKVGLSR